MGACEAKSLQRLGKQPCQRKNIYRSHAAIFSWIKYFKPWHVWTAYGMSVCMFICMCLCLYVVSNSNILKKKRICVNTYVFDITISKNKWPLQAKIANTFNIVRKKFYTNLHEFYVYTYRHVCSYRSILKHIYNCMIWWDRDFLFKCSVIVPNSVMERLSSITAKVLDSTTETMGDERDLQWQQSQTLLGSSRQQSKGQATEIAAWGGQLKL